MVDFCGERRLCVVNTYFRDKSTPKYTRKARSRDRKKLLWEKWLRCKIAKFAVGEEGDVRKTWKDYFEDL